MVEKTVEGIILFWTKQIELKQEGMGDYYNTAFKLGDEWYNFPSEEKESLEKMREAAPKGSKVQFVVVQKEGSKYWNYKQGTLKVLEKGTGYTGQKGSWGFKKNREEVLFTEASIQIQSILRSALTATDDLSTEAVKKRSDELLQWHNSKISEQYVFLNELTKNLKSNTYIEEKKEDPVKEEKVEDDGGITR